MILNILFILAALAAAFAILVASRPSEFRISRSAVIFAPPSAAFVLVNDLRRWPEWSPWAKMDPEARYSYEGPSSGVGAATSWAGRKTGEGSMTITESRPDRFVRFRLEFVKPFRASNTAEFNFTSEGGQTVVAWTMTGRNSFVCKAMGLILNCEKMCGNQFEQGLADLKLLAEAVPVH